MEVTPNKHKRLDNLEALVFKRICNSMHFRFQCNLTAVNVELFFLILFPVDV